MADKKDGWKALGLLLLTPVFMVWGGYVLTILWAWFMVPTFGFHNLRIVNAIGVCIVVRYFTYDSAAARQDHDTFTTVGLAVAVPLFSLGFGWLVHLFM